MGELKRIERWQDALAFRPVKWQSFWDKDIAIGLFLLFVMICSIAAFMGWVVMSFYWRPASMTDELVIMWGLGSMVVCSIIFGVFFECLKRISSAFQMLSFQLVEFWRQNVVGYELWVTQESRDAEMLYYLGRRHALRSPDDRLGPVLVVIPMGGWFARARHHLAHETNCRPRTNVLKWKILGHAIGRGIHPQIRVSDQNGDRQWISLPIFFEIVFETWEVGMLLNTWGEWVQCTHQWRKSAEADRDYFAEKVGVLEEIQGKRRKAEISRLFKAIDMIEASKRYIKSKEGMKIRLWLIEQLLEILPKDDILRLGFEAELDAASTASSPAPIR